jgi:succinate dehydrogenase / fumarate reductase membrane anchor subunit
MGASGGGSHHWWAQRVSSVAMIPLCLWFVLSLFGLPELDYLSVRAWMGGGLNPALLSLLVLVVAHHSWLGVQVIVEDYVHGKGAKLFTLLGSTFLHAVIAAAGVFAVVKVALTNG